MLDVIPVGNEEIADWLEIAIIASGQKGNTNHKLEEWANSLCGLSDFQVAAGLKIIERRSAILKDSYPFEINEYAVVFHKERLNSGYTYLLAISRPSYSATWQNSSPTQEDSDLFEEFVAKVLTSYLGLNSHALAFGWPSKLGRPQEFHLAIEWLAAKMGIEPGTAFRPPRRKDGGVDVVAWKNFGDKRSGFPVYLVQCTLQRDFLSKSRDIDLRLWAGWLEMDRDPLVILAVPKTISPGELWNEISANAIVLDRIRLTEYCHFSNSPDIESYLEKIISKWRIEGDNHLA
jgi:hypothetical protein